MGFNFPSSPSTGQIFTPAGGPTFQYNGAAWQSVTQGIPVMVFVSDTPPVSPALGQLWWESDSGNMFIWYTDADSSQWVQVSGSVSAVQTAQTRNRLVNPAFQISQENGNTASAVINYFAADQWLFQFSSSGTITVQRVQSVTPNGSANRYRATISVADAALAATDYLQFSQLIEGIRVADFRYGTASARQSVLRFGFKGPAGTYSIYIRNSAGNRTYLVNFAISAGQANTDTEQVFVIPGDTTGTWLTDTGIGIGIYIVLAAGTTYQGTTGWTASGPILGTSANTNGLATAGAVYEFFDVGLYLDPLSTGIPPKWEMPDEAQELAACMRYWEKTYPYLDPPGKVYSGSGGGLAIYVQTATPFTGLLWTYKVLKRTNAAIAMYSPWTGASGKMRDQNGAVDINATTTGAGINESHVLINVNNVAVAAANNIFVHAVANARM